MGERHTSVETYTLNEYAKMQHGVHRNALLEHHKQGRIVLPDNFEEVSQDWTFDEYYFLQPVPARQRRVLLHEAGVSSIDPSERDECRVIRASRGRCGCACRVTCDTRTCSCYRAGIRCQVDQMSFPCGCTGDGCSNSFGRVEFNAARVRAHFVKTLMHMEVKNVTGNKPVTSSDNCFDMEQSTYGGSNIASKRCATEEDNAYDVKRLRVENEVLITGSGVDPSMGRLKAEDVSEGQTSHIGFSREIPEYVAEINSQSSSMGGTQIGNRSSCYITEDSDHSVTRTVASNNYVDSLPVVNNETIICTDNVPLNNCCDIFKPTVSIDECDDVGDEIVSQILPDDDSVASKNHSIITRLWKSSCIPSFIETSVSSPDTIAVSNMCSSSSDLESVPNNQMERGDLSMLTNLVVSDEYNIPSGVADSLIGSINLSTAISDLRPTVNANVSCQYQPSKIRLPDTFKQTVTRLGIFTAPIDSKIDHDVDVVKTSGLSDFAVVDSDFSGYGKVNLSSLSGLPTKAAEFTSPLVEVSCKMQSGLRTSCIGQSTFNPVASLVKRPEKWPLWKVDQSSDPSVSEDDCYQAGSYVVGALEPAQSSTCEEFTCYSELDSRPPSSCHLSGLNQVELKSQPHSDLLMACCIYSTDNCSSRSESPKELDATIEERPQHCSELTKDQFILTNSLSESRPVFVLKHSVDSTIPLSEQLKSDSGSNEELFLAGCHHNCESFASFSQLQPEKSSESVCVEGNSVCCLHAATKPSVKLPTTQTCDTQIEEPISLLNTKQPEALYSSSNEVFELYAKTNRERFLVSDEESTPTLNIECSTSDSIGSVDRSQCCSPSAIEQYSNSMHIEPSSRTELNDSSPNELLSKISPSTIIVVELSKPELSVSELSV